MRPPIAELRAPNAPSEKIDPAPAIALVKADSAPADLSWRTKPTQLVISTPRPASAPSYATPPLVLVATVPRRPFVAVGVRRELQAPAKTWALLAQIRRAGVACEPSPEADPPSYASGRPADGTSPAGARRRLCDRRHQLARRSARNALAARGRDRSSLP